MDATRTPDPSHTPEQPAGGISPDFLAALNACNVAASIVELADTIACAAHWLGWDIAQAMAESIKRMGNATVREIGREMSLRSHMVEQLGRQPDAVTSSGGDGGMIVVPRGGL